MQTFYKICLLLLIVGGVNWGLVGLFQFDLVGWLLGPWLHSESVQRGTGGRITKRLLHFCVRQPFARCSASGKKSGLENLWIFQT